ncbi:hypothetical protein J6590_058731 [Homalodisca vitripennis]|nr:hypothetical protein J6590_058731 [Homalodisca vitripennis]
MPRPICFFLLDRSYQGYFFLHPLQIPLLCTNSDFYSDVLKDGNEQQSSPRHRGIGPPSASFDRRAVKLTGNKSEAASSKQAEYLQYVLITAFEGGAARRGAKRTRESFITFVSRQKANQPITDCFCLARARLTRSRLYKQSELLNQNDCGRLTFATKSKSTNHRLLLLSSSTTYPVTPVQAVGVTEPGRVWQMKPGREIEDLSSVFTDATMCLTSDLECCSNNDFEYYVPTSTVLRVY